MHPAGSDHHPDTAPGNVPGTGRRQTTAAPAGTNGGGGRAAAMVALAAIRARQRHRRKLAYPLSDTETALLLGDVDRLAAEVTLLRGRIARAVQATAVLATAPTELQTLLAKEGHPAEWILAALDGTSDPEQADGDGDDASDAVRERVAEMLLFFACPAGSWDETVAAEVRAELLRQADMVLEAAAGH